MGDFSVEIDSIRAAAAAMDTTAIKTATDLQQKLNQLNAYAMQSDWSGVPSCTAFGASYNSAIEAYKAVADDLLKDAKAMQATLYAIASEYNDSDESSRADFNARLAALGTEGYMSQSPADQVYQDHTGDLHSDKPEQAPGQDADTGSSGSTPPSTPAASRTTGTGRVRME